MSDARIDGCLEQTRQDISNIFCDKLPKLFINKHRHFVYFFKYFNTVPECSFEQFNKNCSNFFEPNFGHPA